MPAASSTLASLATVFCYLLVTISPGLLIGSAAGFRGWTLAGTAPLLTYAIGGIAGPWLALAGVPFNVVTFAMVTVTSTGIAFAFRALARRSGGSGAPEPRRCWAGHAHWAIAGSVLLAGGFGAFTMLGGRWALNGMNQSFDSVYHANGIRFIAETGNGSLLSTGQPNWYTEGHEFFYPNAYHLLGSLTYRITETPIPVILNISTAAVPALLALAIIAVIREFRGRAVLAGAGAVAVVAAATVTYHFALHGVYTFLLSLALTPIAPLVVHRYLRRPGLDTGMVCVLAAAGLLAVHSSALFAAVLYTIPMLGQRWIAGRGTGVLKADLVRLIPIVLTGAVCTAPHLFGAIALSTGAIPYLGWPATQSALGAAGSLLTFHRNGYEPQLILAVLAGLGIVTAWRLARLRWFAVSLLPFGILYVAVASSDAPLVKALARPWWDDQYRLLALASIPLALLAAHGLAELHRFLLWVITSAARMHSRWPGVARTVVPSALAVVVLGAFTTEASVLSEQTSGSELAKMNPVTAAPDGRPMVIGPDEIRAMQVLGRLAEPGERAMNDRFDGTVWTYAFSGVRTVAGHYDKAAIPQEAALLAAHFNEYRTNAQVRAACERLNIRWVIVGTGFQLEFDYQPGMRDLAGLPFLQRVYHNDAATVYRLLPRS